MEMKVDVVKRETIKPCSPTPLELRHVELSRFDQITPPLYIPLFLFYAGGDGADRHTKSTKLKTSLSQTLKHYYPLAGRIKDNAYIECNDEGTDYVETTVHARLDDFLKNPVIVELHKFVPSERRFSGIACGSLLLVQANFFQCGGLVIGIYMSHKVSDASTLSAFSKAWSGVAQGSSGIIHPDFSIASMLPPLDIPELELPSIDPEINKCIMRRYVIRPSAIATLKDRVASETVPYPTSLEAVVSLIWKCAMKASGRPHTALTQFVNLRKRFEPPLPDNLAGNLVGYFAVEAKGGEFSLQNSGASMRKELDKFRNFVKQLLGEDGVSVLFGAAEKFGELLMNDQINHYKCTSWCKFPLYEVDFGWGSPTWVSTVNTDVKDAVVLLNTKNGDEIEFFVALSEEDMALFEKDEELLEFAICNPSVL